MFKPIPSTRLLRALQASIEDRRLVCSFCSKRRTLKSHRRAFSIQIAPVTAVNEKKPVVESFKDLHNVLIAFGRSASTYANATQLQLALKSLESKDSITRIAILGLNDLAGPLQLVQALLADPLSPKAQWEKELGQIQPGTKPLLIRPGLKLSLDLSHPLLRTLTIPSTLLERHKVEIFLDHIIDEPENIAALSELVVPNLQARESYSGRTSSIVFPVHRTILFGVGLHAVLDLAGLLRSTTGEAISEMVQVATNVDWETLPSQQAGIIFVNLSKGQHSIRTLRDSLQNAITYEREWLSSKLPSLVSAVLPEVSDSTTLKPAIRNLINHILAEAESAADASEIEATARRSLLDLPEPSREALKLAVSDWAEQAHTEFRAEMANIVESRIWLKLAWWKLFWRIDDVQTIISEAIRRAYLIEAEKSSIFLAGRLAQAGLVLVNNSSTNNLPIFDRSESLNKNINNPPNRDSTKDKPTDQPPPKLTATATKQTAWPSCINTSRLTILQETLPPLVSSAQGHVLSALSLTSLTSLASATAYLSIPTTTLYEAGSIAAVGLVLSAYQLQRKWEQARHVWVRDVQIEGKRALDAVEQLFTRAISEHNSIQRDEDDVRTEVEARRAIEDVRKVLKGMGK